MYKLLIQLNSQKFFIQVRAFEIGDPLTSLQTIIYSFIYLSIYLFINLFIYFSGAESDTGSTALLIVAPIVGLLVIITAVIGVMLCCWMNRRNVMRKRRLDSRTSSENSIPRKF